MTDKPGLARRLIRRSWQIALFTLVVSTSLMYLIFIFVQPQFEAVSLLRVEPKAPNLFAPTDAQEKERSTLPYLQTQVQLIKSDQVLAAAIANPQVKSLASVRESEDPKTELRENLIVDIVPDTYLLRISLKSKSPTDAASIVNAVVDSYRAHAEQYAGTASKRLRDSLEREAMNIKMQIEGVQKDLETLVQIGRVAGPSPRDLLAKNKDLSQPTFKSLGEEHLQRLIADMLNTDAELLTAESSLAVTEQALQANKTGSGNLASVINELGLKVAALKHKKTRQIKNFEQIEFKNKEVNTDNLKSQMLNHQLTSLQSRLDNVTSHLAQLEFESNQEFFRIVVVDPAAVPRTPISNKRAKLMAASTPVVFFLILGWFVLMEIRAGRSARAAELSTARSRAANSDLLEGEVAPFRR